MSEIEWVLASSTIRELSLRVVAVKAMMVFVSVYLIQGDSSWGDTISGNYLSFDLREASVERNADGEYTKTG